MGQTLKGHQCLGGRRLSLAAAAAKTHLLVPTLCRSTLEVRV